MWKVDTLGRRPLLLAGNTGVAASLALLAVCFAVGWTENLAVISLMCAFLACFAFSLGPLPWIFMAEVFPTRIRGRAMGLATLALWAANFVVCQTFPTIDKHWGPAAAFALYAALVLPVFYFGWRIMPETKGHSLEELERYFASNSSMKG
jgi:SP family arabinose:H+ symporter-like MFS transporter